MIEQLTDLGKYFFSYGGNEIVLVLATLFVLPFLYKKFVRERFATSGGRFVATVGLWLILCAMVYGDTFLIAWQAEKFCKAEAGKHVYRTAEADSILGGDISTLGPYGFSYTEVHGGQYTRLTMKNGKIIQEQIWDPTSQYEVAEKYKVVGRGILRQSTVVQDRETHEILGENVLFSIDRGWLDKYFPGEFTAPNCTSPYGEPQRGGGLHSDDLIMSVLTPIKKIQGEKP